MSLPSQPDIEMADVSEPGDVSPEYPRSTSAADASAPSLSSITRTTFRTKWAVDRSFAEFLVHGTRGEAVDYMLSREEELHPTINRASRLAEFYGTNNITQVMVDEAKKDFRSAILQNWSHSVVMNITRLWEADPLSAMEIVSAHQLEHPENFLRCCVLMLKVDPRRFLDSIGNIFELSSGERVEGELGEYSLFNFQGMFDLLTACVVTGGELDYTRPGPLMPSKTDKTYNQAKTWSLANPGSTNPLPTAHMRLDAALSASPVLGALYVSVVSILSRELLHDIAYVHAHPILSRTLEEEDMAGTEHHGAISAAALCLNKGNRADKELRIMSAVGTVTRRELDVGGHRKRLQDDVISPLRRAIKCNPEIARRFRFYLCS
ncbi:hypothetical protein IAT38_007254 [Cryptococcus sp. DSM 104549]